MTKIVYQLVLVLLFGAALIAPQPVAAQPAATVQANLPMQISTPVVARIYFADRAVINQLAARYDVWEVHRNANPAAQYLLALLTPAQQNELRAAGYRLEIDPAKTAQLAQTSVAAAEQTSGIPGYGCYRTVEETYAAMAKLATDHPALASWNDIGDSWEKVTPGGKPGYDLYALVLTNKAKAGPKPKFLLMAAIHAREYTTAELATRFAEELVAKYNVDPDVTWLLDYFEIHIIPQANPDGRKIAETGDLWRKNTDNDDGCINPEAWGVDLNRNSSFKWNTFDGQSNPCNITYLGPSPASEPEVQAIEAYARSIFPAQRGPNDNDPAPPTTEGVFITLHSYAQEVLYPWGWTAEPAPNLTQLQTLGRKFGYFNHYEVCNGQACLYGTSGTTDDFTYGELGVASYTFEMGQNFFESCSSFNNTVLPQNMPALYYAAKAARRPYQNPAGPDTLAVSVASPHVLRGAHVTLQATADDTRYDSNGWGIEPTQAIAAARYSIDAPSWITGTQVYTMTAVDGAFNKPSEAVQAVVPTAGWALGRHILFVESQDQDGNWGVPSAVFVEVADTDYAVAIDEPQVSTKPTAGSQVDYVLPVTNIGVMTDTYTVTVGASRWPVTASAQLGPVAPTVTAPLTVTVRVPPTATAGLTNTVTITLTSQAKPDQQTARSLLTQVADYLYYFPIVGR